LNHLVEKGGKHFYPIYHTVQLHNASIKFCTAFVRFCHQKSTLGDRHLSLTSIISKEELSNTVRSYCTVKMLFCFVWSQMQHN